MDETSNRVMLDGAATSFAVSRTFPTAKRYAAWLIDYRVDGQITEAEMLAGFADIVSMLPAGTTAPPEPGRPLVTVALRLTPHAAASLADCAEIGFEGLDDVGETVIRDVGAAIATLRAAAPAPAAETLSPLREGQPDSQARASHDARSAELVAALEAADASAMPGATVAFMSHHGFSFSTARGRWIKANQAGRAEIWAEHEASDATARIWNLFSDAGGLGTHSGGSTLWGAVFAAEEAMNEGDAGGRFAAPATETERG